MMKKKILCLCGLLAACQGTNPLLTHTKPYVSASEPGADMALIAALEEAQAEDLAETLPPSGNKGIIADKNGKSEGTTAENVGTKLPVNATIWSQPRTSTEKGMTLTQEAERHRLNDALDTTPLGGVAKWESGALTYVFLPNSPVYTPHQSGGRCRDGIFSIYGDGFNDDRLRGLFCQTGVGADWLLKMRE